MLLVRLVQLCFRRAAGLVCRKVVASYLPDRERLPKDELVINYLCQLTKPPSDLEVLFRKRFFIIGWHKWPLFFRSLEHRVEGSHTDHNCREDHALPNTRAFLLRGFVLLVLLLFAQVFEVLAVCSQPVFLAELLVHQSDFENGEIVLCDVPPLLAELLYFDSVGRWQTIDRISTAPLRATILWGTAIKRLFSLLDRWGSYFKNVSELFENLLALYEGLEVYADRLFVSLNVLFKRNFVIFFLLSMVNI